MKGIFVILTLLRFKIVINLSTVDASAAGEGQLEISINEGEVPNHVQVVGGGRCLGNCNNIIQEHA